MIHLHLHLLLVSCLLGALPGSGRAATVSRVRLTANHVTISGRAEAGGGTLFEFQPPDQWNVVRTVPDGEFHVELPRFDSGWDRVYSGFAMDLESGEEGKRVPRFAEALDTISKHANAFPVPKSKKGLQVQMVEDALSLGIQHAALNVNQSQFATLRPAPHDFPWAIDGETCWFRKGAVDALDRQVKPLSDAGVVVSLILLCYKSGDRDLDRTLLHPDCDPAAPNRLSAFNTATRDGVRWFKAWIEFLADRYSHPDQEFGRAVNFIVGNEVNSHWEWYNLGRIPMKEFVTDYLRSVRLCHAAVRKYSAAARVYVSLEHHWNITYQPDPNKGFPGRAFLEEFNEQGRRSGNFDWHVAFHPYPENLFECRTWLDKTASFDETTPRITFKNLEMLPRHLRRPELLYEGAPRRIILSEQGFHSPLTDEGELWQAAAYAYAFVKVRELAEIDSFILHRHVDHGGEGGLNLGLWRRNPAGGHPAAPGTKKKIYEVFRAADTREWEDAFRFALPIIGIESWAQVFRPVEPSR
jgi:hypothetical protein